MKRFANQSGSTTDQEQRCTFRKCALGPLAVASLIVAGWLGVRPASAEDPLPEISSAASRNQNAALVVPGRAPRESKLALPLPETTTTENALPSAVPPQLRYQPDPAGSEPRRLWTSAKQESTLPDPKRLIGYVAGSLGLAGIGVGATTSIMAANTRKDSVDRQCSDTLRMCSRDSKFASSGGASLSRVSAVGWAVGALGIGVGAYFLLSKDKRTGTQTAVGADLYQGGGGVRVNRSW